VIAAVLGVDIVIDELDIGETVELAIGATETVAFVN